MSIQEVWGKFKDFWREADVLLAAIIVVTALASFGLGRYSATDQMSRKTSFSAQKAEVVSAKELKDEDSAENANVLESEAATAEEGKYVASKSGTKYHLPWCGGAKQIKETNKIWFDTKEEAEAAGYTPATNCKGI